MQSVRRPVLAGILAGAVVLVAACSDPAPTQVPSPAATSAAPQPGASATSGALSTPTSAQPSAQPSVPTTAQPSAGGGGSVEPSRPVETAPPKKLDESTRTAGLTVSLVSVRATAVRATAPGDRSGPGVLVRLRMVNATGTKVDTSFTQVSLRSDAGRTGSLVDGPPSDPVGGSLRAGRTAEGTYAFLLDDATAAAVTVAVYVTAGQPVVTFSGRVS